MVLDQKARGELERYIDYLIKGVPQLMSRFREKEFKNILRFQNEEDFLYGAVYGGIIFGYTESFYTMFRRHLTDDEMLDFETIVVKRMREVKNAITNTG
jgi:hypothetical protein